MSVTQPADRPGSSGASTTPRVARRAPRENRILASLPEAERLSIEARLEIVELAQHTVLQEIDEEIEYVYFPLAGVASLIASGTEGEQVDTAIIGNEGMVGLPVFLGTGRMPVSAVVQVDMEAARLKAGDLRQELERGGQLINVLQRYAQMVLVELAQLVLCNRAHTIEQRAARWILQLHHRKGEPAPFNMTQEFLAAMLASPRPHVSQVLASFRDAGHLTYGRGTMELVHPDGLESKACACYRTIRDELDRLLATGEQYDKTGEA